MSSDSSGGNRVPPQSIEAEEAVLGAILLDNRALDRANEILTADDFYREAHRRIFRALNELDDRRERADVITLTECLKRRGDLEAVGGAAAIAELVERTATTANVDLYAQIVKDKAILRALMEASNDIAQRAASGTGDVSEFLDDAERMIFEISQRKIRQPYSRLESIIVQSIKTIEALYEKKEAVTGVPTGFYEFDRLTSGLQPSDLIIVAGRPSMGKSALATNMAQYAAANCGGRAVVMFSLEMSKESLVMRMLCGEARVDGTKVRTGYLGERDFPRLAMAAGRLADLPFYIDDTPALSVLELRAKARRLQRENEKNGGLALIVIDYLQLMRAHKDVDNREQEISLISRSLKALAKELNVPVIALSQLNRAVEARADKRPMMSDLRESGAIEQDADLIVFVYRDDFYNKASPEEGIAEIIIAKQRNGPQGTVKLAFRKEYTTFENLSTREDDELVGQYDEAEL
ncbi:MAG TPA: replicative DNA helicase [Candidatus Binatia bacterium]